ncbi:MAG: CoB--CoM heterodisulfide reductase subunit C [Methanobrevibacter sp.]|uniref:CoB--CoM heterodisulfide reductase subunit C n=1 Tax=Methanobrevibacter sp. TaxID=66852 RepID=UPI0026E0978A|nr:CoB--CoM heterodisulfide reductase subunit C [Methanobrevibacter sp.]MDO5848828.1 CoB--CoM heterodisulfide reductase subunit C [Methanobrevibacter sp.]
MSILSRLRSLFGGGDKEEKNDSTAKAEENVKVTSSKEKLDDNIVSGKKSSEPISKPESGSKDIPSEKDLDKKESVPETEVEKSEETTIPELAEEATEVAQERINEVAEEEEKSEETTIPELAEEATEVAQERINEVAEEEEKAEEEGSDLIDEEDASEDESDDEAEEVEPEENEDEIEDENTDENDKERDNMTLLTDKELITSESLDKDFTAAFIDAGIETVKNCFQCGTCGGSCPSGRRTPYKVRQLVRKCLLGLKDDVISDDALWMCTTCYTCQERCPRSVIIVGIVKKARNIAAHAGYMAKAHKMTGLFVITTGHGVPINPVTKELRERVGLGPLPPTTHMFPEALEEVQKICKLTGFDELIGYDEATGELKD